MQVGDVLLEKYRIERELGAGGMGKVFAARHLELEHQVAIKFLLTDGSNGEIVARFLREARAATRIRSEHVVRVIDVGRSPQGAPFMVMEFLEGKDLEAVLKERGPLPIDEAVDYLLQAMEALAEAHAHGIVHRDLKPANLFLTRRHNGAPWIKVIDFGISKFIAEGSTGMTRTQGIMGTPLYMSPEQLQSAKNVDARTDIWALGVILYQLVTGRPPFMAETMPQLVAQVFHGSTTPLREHRPDAPPAFADIVDKALQKGRDQRYATVADLAADLLPFASRTGRASVRAIAQHLAVETEEWHAARVSASPASMAATHALEPANLAAPQLVQTDASWGRTAPEYIPAPAAASNRPWIAGVIALATVLTIGGIWALRRGPTSPPSEATAPAAAPKRADEPTRIVEPPVVVPPPAAPTPTPSTPTSSTPNSSPPKPIGAPFKSGLDPKAAAQPSVAPSASAPPPPPPAVASAPAPAPSAPKPQLNDLDPPI